MINNRVQLEIILDSIVEWTLKDGSLKSQDHSYPKRKAEEALRLIEPLSSRMKRRFMVWRLERKLKNV